MKPQSLSDRINSEYSAAFMEKVLALALEKKIEHVRKGKAAEALDGFDRVVAGQGLGDFFNLLAL